MHATKFSVQIPDTAYWKRQIKCQYACPVHTDAGGYARAIAEGDFEKAYLIARGPNPLASICGRICGAPCEAACRRSDIDASVTLRALKRFVTERFGVESGRYERFDKRLQHLINRLHSLEANECEDLDDIRHLLRHFRNPSIPADAPTVGIIGSGPSGLAAAHDLCLMGIKPTIYEMEPVPAGMLYLGVPEYRLPRNLIEAEVEVIKALGTEIICDTKVGEDIPFSELRSRHDAVLIAVGAKKSRKIPIPNIDAPGVMGGIDFLRDMALGYRMPLVGKVVVIGGGNVAYDVARSLVREMQLDVSRTAVRLGAKEVHMVCLESLDEMPADNQEIREGDEEGVIRHNSWGPKRIILDNTGRACGVEFVKCLSVFNEKKQFAPRYDDSQRMVLDAFQIFLTIGQASDLSFIDSEDIGLDERGRLKLDSDCSVIGAKGVFAAGDVAYGPRLMIDAVASGKQMARRIYSYLTQERILTKTTTAHAKIEGYRRERGYECARREFVPAMPPEQRNLAMNMTVEVEKGFSEVQAVRQGGRCLNCAVNTIFDSAKCVLCGGCADVCPQKCLQLVAVERIQGGRDLAQLLQNYLGDTPVSRAAAIIKDETACIRCGLCADRCPAGAITMEIFSFKEEIV